MMYKNTKEQFFFFIVISIYIFFMFAIFFVNLTYKAPHSTFKPLKEIYTRDGKIIATNILGYVYYVNTKNATDEDIIEANKFINKYCFFFKKRNIILQANEYYLIHKSNIEIMNKKSLPKTIICRRENYRFYPYGEIFAHPVGLYRDGLEFGLESYNKSISNKFNTDKPIITTLLFPFQFILHKEMKAGYLEYKCSKVHGVIQNEEGEILAMVSIPDFDPLLNQQIPKDTLNGVIYNSFEFGSTIKFFSFVLAAHLNVINPHSKFNIALGAKVGNHKITDTKDIRESLTPQEILRRSSNIGTIQMSELIWDKVGDFFYKTLMLGDPIIMNNFKTANCKIQHKDGPKYLYQHYCMGYSFRTTMLNVIRAFTGVMTNKMYNPSIILEKKKKEFQSISLSKNITFIIDVLLGISQTNPILKKYNVYGKTGTARIITNGVYIKNHINTFYMCMFVKNNKKYFMLLVYEEPHSKIMEASANIKITASKIIKSIMETDL